MSTKTPIKNNRNSNISAFIYAATTKSTPHTIGIAIIEILLFQPLVKTMHFSARLLVKLSFMRFHLFNLICLGEY